MDVHGIGKGLLFNAGPHERLGERAARGGVVGVEIDRPTKCLGSGGVVRRGASPIEGQTAQIGIMGRGILRLPRVEPLRYAR